MTQTATPADQITHHAERRSVMIRRRAARVLRQVPGYSDLGFVLGVLAIGEMWLAHLGPAWITHADSTRVLVYGVVLYFVGRFVNAVARCLVIAVEPILWDGYALYGIAQSLEGLRGDIKAGADTYDVHDSLDSSEVLGELTNVVGALAQRYAARGDTREAQRLHTAVRHLREAGDHLGFPEFDSEPADTDRVVEL